MPKPTLTPLQDWTAYYNILLDKQGPEKLRRIRSRLYQKLETINNEIDELEEDKELEFMPAHPEYVPFIDQQIEALLSSGREVSIQLETVITLLADV